MNKKKYLQIQKNWYSFCTFIYTNDGDDDDDDADAADQPTFVYSI